MPLVADNSRGGVPMPLTTGCVPPRAASLLARRAASLLALGLLLMARGARAQGVLQVSPLFGTAQV
jgi:hypothetical protein